MPDREQEIRRIAHHLWILAKRPVGGPEQFHHEAEQIVEQRGLYRLDAIQQASQQHEKGDSTPSSSDKDDS